VGDERMSQQRKAEKDFEQWLAKNKDVIVRGIRDIEDEARVKAYMEAKMKHIKMYNECMNLADGLNVEKFAELVRADEREKVAKWMISKGYSTGHGDTIEDLLAELEQQLFENWTNSVMKVAAAEREACAKIADGWPDYDVQGLADEIRARCEK
jgi:hypothetical protein